MANFGTKFVSHSKYDGLMIILKVYAANRILTEVLSFNNDKNYEKGNGDMKNEYHNNLIIISVNEGYSEDVMHVARKAGATGGTVIKGRLAEIEKKDKIIDLMANDFWHEHYLYFMEIEKLDNKDELIKYFTKQVEKRN